MANFLKSWNCAPPDSSELSGPASASLGLWRTGQTGQTGKSSDPPAWEESDGSSNRPIRPCLSVGTKGVIIFGDTRFLYVPNVSVQRHGVRYGRT